MTESETRAYNRGYDIATARAESRLRLGLPIERDPNSDKIKAERDQATSVETWGQHRVPA